MFVDIDACDRKVGCVILKVKPVKSVGFIGYWSRTLTLAETRYDTTKCECLAVVWSMLILRLYLEGRRFTIRTDQASLR